MTTITSVTVTFLAQEIRDSNHRNGKLIELVGSSANLRSGLQSLGMDYEDLVGLHNEVTAWAKAVAEAYEGELKELNLL